MGEEPRFVEVIVQFEKIGEEHVLVAPGIIIPVEEFLKEWQKIIEEYIEKKIVEHF
jgi:hypothetical protein